MCITIPSLINKKKKHFGPLDFFTILFVRKSGQLIPCNLLVAFSAEAGPL